MKKLFVLLFAVCLFGVAFSQISTEMIRNYCIPSVPDDVKQTWIDQGLPFSLMASYDAGCVCCKPDFEVINGQTRAVCVDAVPFEGGWRDVMCVNGAMLQERTVQSKVPPFCSDVSTYKEQASVPEDLCKTCPEPEEIGLWTEVACVNGIPLEQRQVVGWKFDVAVDECVQVNEVFVRSAEGRDCNLFTSAQGNYGGITIVLIIISGIALIVWKRKKIKKMVQR